MNIIGGQTGGGTARKQKTKPKMTQGKKVLMEEITKKRKSLESFSKVVMVFLCIKTWLKIVLDHLQNEENIL